MRLVRRAAGLRRPGRGLHRLLHGVENLAGAITTGDIDVIVSAHDPQDADGKRRPFAEAADGAIGVETLLSAALRLYHDGSVELSTLLRALTANPARLLGLPSGRLAKEAPADLVLIDLDTPFVVNPELLRTRSKNTPFDEARLQGRALMTLVAGRSVYNYAEQRSA